MGIAHRPDCPGCGKASGTPPGNALVTSSSTLAISVRGPRRLFQLGVQPLGTPRLDPYRSCTVHEPFREPGRYNNQSLQLIQEMPQVVWVASCPMREPQSKLVRDILRDDLGASKKRATC